MGGGFWVTEAQMGRIRPFFPKARGRKRVDDRRVLSGIIYIQRNGLMWSEGCTPLVRVKARTQPTSMARRRHFTTVGCAGAGWGCLRGS